MAYGDLKVRNLIWNTGSGDNTVVLSTLATENYVTTNFAPKNAPTFSGTINGADLILSGNLTVNGTQTIINTQTLDVEDKQIEIGKVSSPSDITADQGGIVLKGATDKTFLWVNANAAWTSSESIKLGDNKKLLIGTGSDLEITHSSGNSTIVNSTGQLLIRSSTALQLGAPSGEVYLAGIENGAVELYHDNVKTFATEDNGIYVYGPEGGLAQILLYADEGDDGPDKWRIQSDTSGNFKVGNFSTGSWVDGLNLDGSNNATFSGTITTSSSITSGGLTISSTEPRIYLTDTNNNSDFEIRNVDGTFRIFDSTETRNCLSISSAGDSTFAGTVSDSKGDLRKIIQNTQGSAYTLVAADAGKHILASGNITIPNSVFSAGDGVVIVNNTSGDLTITSGITNLYLGTDGSTGNKTLASRCTCTVLFTSGTAGYISGGGLS